MGGSSSHPTGQIRGSQLLECETKPEVEAWWLEYCETTLAVASS